MSTSGPTVGGTTLKVVPPSTSGPPVAENTFLGAGTKKPLQAHNGKLGEDDLQSLFRPFEPGIYLWTRRSIPTPATGVECFLVKKTCSNMQAFESLGIPYEHLAFRRQQVAQFVKEHEGSIPAGGHGGAWMLYWEGADPWFAYLYRSGPGLIGLVSLPWGSKDEQVLPAHHYHSIVIPERNK